MKKVSKMFGTNEYGEPTIEEKATPGIVSFDVGYYCCFDDETLDSVSKKLNLDAKEMLRLNKRHISDLTLSAKLIAGTCLDLPEELVLPKQHEDARLRTMQARLPLTSLKDLKLLRDHPVLKKVNLLLLRRWWANGA